MHPVLVVQFLYLLLLANGTPVVAKKIFGDAFNHPIDGGRVLADGRPLFGGSKTVRGILTSIAVTTIGAPLVGMPWGMGAAAAASAMAGDLFSSFLKRRMGMPSSSMALGIDQVPESLLPALACRFWLPFSILDIGAIVLSFLAGELILSRIAYRLKLRDRPY
jgi:CDP-2,3-bis-(O-geranylgeranyl)-sn-glycerol synthase